jgi:hypothetical protein
MILSVHIIDQSKNCKQHRPLLMTEANGSVYPFTSYSEFAQNSDQDPFFVNFSADRTLKRLNGRLSHATEEPEK